MSQRRVVVTGMGLVSPLGSQVERAWSAVLKGQTGVVPITSFDASSFTTRFAGLVPDFEVLDYFSAKESRKYDRFVQYGVGAAVQAIREAGIDVEEGLDLDRIGVCMGSGIGGIGSIETNCLAYAAGGPRRISPFFIPGSIINNLAGIVSILYGYRGPNSAVVSACSTGAHNIGFGARMIAAGDADVMVTGGAEYASTPLSVGGFSAVRALSTRNDAPERASRPWDKDRDGFVLGDGAGALVLESYDHAKKRGATILAELAGFGMSADAFHITQPAEGGRGAMLAMQNALRDAKINLAQVDYINAHGTSTILGDLAETEAIKKLFGARAYRLAVSSTKSMTGHLMGAAGAVEAIFSVLALRDQVAPATINLDEPGEGCDLDYVPHVARAMPIQTVLSNSFGFGGTNAALLFKKI